VNRIYDLFVFLKTKQLDIAIAPKMLKQLFLNPDADFESILTALNFKKITKEEVVDRIKDLENKFSPARKDTSTTDKINSIMGKLRTESEGNLNLRELAEEIK
jgi:Glu-tRNA(Gln) amidotransferase subunit E-like FAD-binding protein